MKFSPCFIKLLSAIEDYIENSSKKDYIFTIEEQLELEKQLKILNNQLNALIDYELKRLKQKES